MGQLDIYEVNGTKRITATNARVHLGALMDYIKRTGESVIIERNKTPVAKAMLWTKFDAQRRTGEAL